MSKTIITYAAGAHEELLDVALPGYQDFARRHGYELAVGECLIDENWPPAWNKIPLLIQALRRCDQVVWFDCDLIIVNPTEDLPWAAMGDAHHGLVRHMENNSEVPNSGVWMLTPHALPLLETILQLGVFKDHGWWEQAALMTLMGYTVPPQNTDFRDTRCRNVQQTVWYQVCRFLRLCWNNHPNYRADKPRIVHCSYPDMTQRIEVMRELVRDPTYEYPRYDTVCPYCKKQDKQEEVSD